jgi:hypothetical protein
MIEKIPAAEHVVAFRVSGSITAEDVTSASEAIRSSITAHERVSLYTEVEGTTRYTLEGFFKDLIEGLNRLNDLGKIYRIAVVTEKGWIAAMARVEGLVFAFIDVRVFSMEDKKKALAWASEAPPVKAAEAAVSPGIHLIQTTNDAVLAYEIDGRVTDADANTIAAALKEAFGRHEKVDVLARINTYAGFDLVALLNDELVKMQFKALSKVGKYAVIGAKPWMRNLLELANPLIGPEIRIFDPEDEQSAWQWIGAQPALLPASGE